MKFWRVLKKKPLGLSLRAWDISQSFHKTRWHSDGYYYSPYNGVQYKAAITLKGMSTLFYYLSAEFREKFNTLQFEYLQKPENIALADKLIDNNPHLISTASPQQGAIFIVGNPKLQRFTLSLLLLVKDYLCLLFQEAKLKFKNYMKILKGIFNE